MAVTMRPLHPEPETGFVLPTLPSLPTHKILAVIAWAVGCIPTFYAVATLFLLSFFWTLVVTIITQSMLTLMESPIWQRYVLVDDETTVVRERSWINYAVLLVDVLINFGSTIKVAQRLHMIEGVQALGATFAMQFALTGMLLSVVALVFAVILAALPEKLWHAATA